LVVAYRAIWFPSAINPSSLLLFTIGLYVVVSLWFISKRLRLSSAFRTPFVSHWRAVINASGRTPPLQQNAELSARRMTRVGAISALSALPSVHF
jgi:hypothetical protein